MWNRECSAVQCKSAAEPKQVWMQGGSNGVGNCIIAGAA